MTQSRALFYGRRAASFAAALILWAGVTAFYQPPDDPEGGAKQYQNKTFRLDGKFVHNVGRLHLQITNIGQTGNAANPSRTTVPSAEYPPGSGFDHLYAAGLWVGAIDASGIPHVTTAAYNVEFSPETPTTISRSDIAGSLSGAPGDTRSDTRQERLSPRDPPRRAHARPPRAHLSDKRS